MSTHSNATTKAKALLAAVCAGTVLMGWQAVNTAAHAQTLTDATDGIGTHACSMTTQEMFPSAQVNEDESTPTAMPGHQMDVSSSVQVSRDVLREAYQASKDAYTSKLQKYAKCTPDQARKSVMTAHPGMKVEGLQLRNIRTSLVYVSVVSDDQDKYLVIVDAGNGKVLMDKRLETHHERVFANHG